jgi:large subunit ribosomal protein L25
MAEVTLEVSPREGSGKGLARKLRRDGKVPAVVYGGHLKSIAITVDRKNVSELIQKSEHGIRSLFLLQMAGGEPNHAMIKEVTIDPISRLMRHIDFIRVVADEKVRLTVPVHVTGNAIGVKNGGVLDFQARELHIECLPDSIPDSIDVDVTSFNIHDVVRVSELKLPSGVKVLDDPERVVVGVTTPRAEALPEEPVAVAEPEVAKKGKPETK